jgi:hypothetical protein
MTDHRGPFRSAVIAKNSRAARAPTSRNACRAAPSRVPRGPRSSMPSADGTFLGIRLRLADRDEASVARGEAMRCTPSGTLSAGVGAAPCRKATAERRR